MELVLYRDDTFIGLFNSYQEVADYLSVKVSTAQWLSRKANFKRNNKVKLYNYSKHDYRYYEELEELI